RPSAVSEQAAVRGKGLVSEGSVRPAPVGALVELWADELGACNEAIAFVVAEVDAFGGAARHLRVAEPRHERREIEAATSEGRHEAEAELADQRVAPRNAPELAARAIVDVEREEPIRQAIVADVVDGVAPLTEQHQIGIERVDEARFLVAQPAAQGLEL